MDTQNTNDSGTDTNTDYDRAAERIRATAGENSPRYQQGRESGRQWAAESADADNIEDFGGVDRSQIEDAERGQAGSVLANELRLDVDDLFGDDFRHTPISNTYVLGFYDGAAEAITEINKRL